MANLPAYTAYLYRYAPWACYGNPEKVKAWLGRLGENYETKQN